MKHLIRAAGVLIALIILAFVLPRIIPTNTVEGLEKYGFYSGKDNSQEWQQVSEKYADPVGCNTCHQDKYSAWTSSAHKTVSCENCHGAGQTHLEKGTELVINRSNQLCETCHSDVLARPKNFPQVKSNVHGNKQATCITCHQPHDPVIPTISHKVPGYDDCLLCHKAGGLKPLPKDHDGRTTNDCLNCHTSI